MDPDRHFVAQGPRYYFDFLDEASDTEHYSAVAVHWAVDDAVVNIVLGSVAHHHGVTYWKRGDNHSNTWTNYLKLAAYGAVEHAVVVDEADASKVHHDSRRTAGEAHAIVHCCWTATNWRHWLYNSRTMTWTTHFNTWSVAHCTATPAACHCRWCCQTCSHQDDRDA